MLSEHQEQANLIKWANLQARLYPELALLFAIPNGGLRDVRVARKLKLEGVKSGVPDLFLPVARRGYHGLFIELKSTKGKPTKKQVSWLAQLDKQGFKAVVCRGFDAATGEIIRYLGIGSG